MFKLWSYFMSFVTFQTLFSPRDHSIASLFYIETNLVVFFEKIIFYMPGKFWYGQNLVVFGQIDIFGLFDLYHPNAAIIFHNFLYGNKSCGVLWENHILYARKILIWPKFGRFGPKFGHFLAKILIFWSFWPISSKRRYKFS